MVVQCHETCKERTKDLSQYRVKIICEDSTAPLDTQLATAHGA
jgi:hypothetical protein